MRLQELFETTEDDRDISALSKRIYSYIASDYQGVGPEDAAGPVGTVAEICNLPEGHPLGDINIVLVTDEELKKREVKDAKKKGIKLDPYKMKSSVGYWIPARNTIEFNTDFMNSNQLKSTVAHELRHALDDKKSDNWANSSDNKSYGSPRKKEHRRTKDTAPDDKTPYLAEPAEINARFMEVQHALTDYIPRIYAKFEPNQIKQKILQYIKRLLEEYRIAQLFPEKTQSKDYQRLIKRVMAFAEAEMKDAEQATQKSAQGSW